RNDDRDLRELPRHQRHVLGDRLATRRLDNDVVLAWFELDFDRGAAPPLLAVDEDRGVLAAGHGDFERAARGWWRGHGRWRGGRHRRWRVRRLRRDRRRFVGLVLGGVV